MSGLEQKIRVDPAEVEPLTALSPLRRDAQARLLHFALGRGTEADLKQLQQWCRQSVEHREAFAEAMRLWKGLGEAADLAKAPVASIIAFERSSAGAGPARPGRRLFLGGAIAATVAAGVTHLALHPPLALWPSASELMADYRTRPGERLTLAIGPGGSIELNTRTSLARRAMPEGGEGLELIAGEALLTLDAGIGFRLLAGAGQIGATGGRVNVRRDADTIRVTCLEGRALVTHRTGQLALTAGRQARYDPDRLDDAVAVDGDDVVAWRAGLLIFNSVPLAQAISEINRYRATPIMIANASLRRRLVTARVRLDQLDQVVEEIYGVFGAKPLNLPGGVVILT